jgi:hypothetical protein
MAINMLPIVNKVVVVGSGISMAKHMQGLFIDQYDVVVRVGEYHIKGWEPYVGTKTTIWAAGSTKPLKYQNMNGIAAVWNKQYLNAINIRRFPSKGQHWYDLMPAGVEASDTFRAIIACVTRWPKNLVSITGHGPGCYWTGEPGKSTEQYKLECAAIRNLMRVGLVWDRLDEEPKNIIK